MTLQCSARLQIKRLAECSFQIYSKQLLLKHIQKVHPQYTFTCKTCCYTTNENRQQKIHQYLNLCLYTPNKRVFECPKCHYLASYKIVNGHIQSVIFK